MTVQSGEEHVLSLKLAITFVRYKFLVATVSDGLDHYAHNVGNMNVTVNHQYTSTHLDTLKFFLVNKFTFLFIGMLSMEYRTRMRV